MSIRIPSFAFLAVILAACGASDMDPAESKDASTNGHDGPTGTAITARLAELPDAVLDGTEVTELSVLQVLGINESAAGEYTVDQGGAVLSASLVRTGDGWQLTRTHTEPGWPADETAYMLQQEQTVLRSNDESATVVLCSEGLLVHERDAEVVPPDLWVLYRRVH